MPRKNLEGRYRFRSLTIISLKKIPSDSKHKKDNMTEGNYAQLHFAKYLLDDLAKEFTSISLCRRLVVRKKSTDLS